MRVCKTGSKNPYTGIESRMSSHRTIVGVGEGITKDPTWFDNAVTTDESWAYVYDPLTKQQSSRWVKRGGDPPEKQKS